jgi:8-oxo-dGTP pyrophosphatase MutT (NUDIX family)
VDERVRAAASLIVGRDGGTGLELLVIERSAASRFLPGYAAFPGGAVEPGDAELAARWWGPDGEAARACAIRELVEETNLGLTDQGIGPADSLDAVHRCPPRSDQMVEIARWIAPKRVPVRFDARYYAVKAPSGVDARADEAEVAAAWWQSPRGLLEEWEAGARRLYWPTYFTMARLVPCRTVEDLTALRFDTREPRDDEMARLPRSTFWQD